MRILHIGSGFRPWRRGGLVAYIEDLMEAQVERGHEVTYFFSGRLYPWRSRPRLKRWERRGVEMLEVINSPLYDHGRQPELELDEPRVSRMLSTVIAERRPEVVHVQELAGLPSSVLDVARDAGIPTVVTLQDYFWMCPTFKLLDSEGRVCLRREIGVDCVATTAADPRDPGMLFAATWRHDAASHSAVRRIPDRWRGRIIEGSAQLAAGRAIARRGEGNRTTGTALARAFQRRRDVNVARLSRANRVIAMSHRTAEIHQLLGLETDRLRTVGLTLAHVEHLRPRTPNRHGPVTFATLAAFESQAKGGELLVQAVRRLSARVGAERFRVLVYGGTHPDFVIQAARIPSFDLRGPYIPAQLDGLLDEVDVGLMTSVWEEAYGYAGMEFLAKGIPIIANAIGGMVDYAREGETGWLNHSCSAEELAGIMLDVVEHPDRIDELNTRLVANRSTIIKPMSRHAEEMEAIYGDAISDHLSHVRRRVAPAGPK